MFSAFFLTSYFVFQGKKKVTQVLNAIRVNTFISFLSELHLKFKCIHPLSIRYMNIISADTAFVFEFLGIVQSSVFLDCKRLCL